MRASMLHGVEQRPFTREDYSYNGGHHREFMFVNNNTFDPSLTEKVEAFPTAAEIQAEAARREEKAKFGGTLGLELHNLKEQMLEDEREGRIPERGARKSYPVMKSPLLPPIIPHLLETPQRMEDGAAAPTAATSLGEDDLILKDPGFLKSLRGMRERLPFEVQLRIACGTQQNETDLLKSMERNVLTDKKMKSNTMKGLLTSRNFRPRKPRERPTGARTHRARGTRLSFDEWVKYKAEQKTLQQSEVPVVHPIGTFGIGDRELPVNLYGSSAFCRPAFSSIKNQSKTKGIVSRSAKATNDMGTVLKESIARIDHSRSQLAMFRRRLQPLSKAESSYQQQYTLAESKLDKDFKGSDALETRKSLARVEINAENSAATIPVSLIGNQGPNLHAFSGRVGFMGMPGKDPFRPDNWVHQTADNLGPGFYNLEEGERERAKKHDNRGTMGLSKEREYSSIYERPNVHYHGKMPNFTTKKTQVNMFLMNGRTQPPPDLGPGPGDIIKSPEFYQHVLPDQSLRGKWGHAKRFVERIPPGDESAYYLQEKPVLPFAGREHDLAKKTEDISESMREAMQKDLISVNKDIVKDASAYLQYKVARKDLVNRHFEATRRRADEIKNNRATYYQKMLEQKEKALQLNKQRSDPAFRWVNIVALACRTALFLKRCKIISALGIFRGNDHWAAVKIQRFWRRAIKRRIVYKRNLAAIRIATAWKAYLFKSKMMAKKVGRRNCVVIMHDFFISVTDPATGKLLRGNGKTIQPGLVSMLGLVRRYKYNVLLIQRMWRRTQIRRTAEIEMLLRHWDLSVLRMLQDHRRRTLADVEETARRIAERKAEKERHFDPTKPPTAKEMPPDSDDEREQPEKKEEEPLDTNFSFVHCSTMSQARLNFVIDHRALSRYVPDDIRSKALSLDLKKRRKRFFVVVKNWEQNRVKYVKEQVHGMSAARHLLHDGPDENTVPQEKSAEEQYQILFPRPRFKVILPYQHMLAIVGETHAAMTKRSPPPRPSNGVTKI